MNETRIGEHLPLARPPAPAEVVVVGGGARAAAWLAPLRRSGRLRAVATVGRGADSFAPDLARYRSLEEALIAHPSAAFAVALPPRSGLEAGLRLARAGRSGIVEAPLHEALIDAPLGPEADAVRVAHGWVTLPGCRTIAAILGRAGSGKLFIEVAGLPEEDGCDLWEGLVHGLALVRALLPAATPSAARLPNGGTLEVSLAEAKWTVQLRVLAHGQRLAARIERAGEPIVWSWQRDRETITRGAEPMGAARATTPAPLRALAQLLPDAARGDGLVEAAAVLRLARSCRALLPSLLPPGGRPLRQSASIGRRRPDDVLARLGLSGELESGGEQPAVLKLTLPPEPFELWAFRAGVKPVAFLTVRPDEVDRTLSFFGNAPHERRERRVQIGEQDRWTDRRDEGEPRVELYIARDAELARRAAHLQAEVDPTQALREIGALVGYPPCCVEAFARQDDRANNSRNRYESWARTLAADGSTPTPWPWELNNLHTMIAPFYPCSYRCDAALAWARACLAEMATVHPGFAAKLRATLARPVLYFDHDHQLVFDGTWTGGRVSYRGVALAASPSAQFATLAAAVGRGDRLSFDDRELVAEREPRTVLRLARTDPALGFIAPFGSSAGG
jgi:hypothetical protein